MNYLVFLVSAGLLFLKPIGSSDKYAQRYAHVAIAEMEKYGIPASIKLAQAILESGRGTSRLAVQANNHFGMKCREFNNPIMELIDGCIDYPDSDRYGNWSKAKFLNFKTVWASYRAHSLLLSSGRYEDLQKYGRDYRKWAYGLQEKGYAVDPQYAEKLIRVIEHYKLYHYDKH